MTHKGVAIVTGSAQGIGQAIALQLALDGYDVTINDIESKRPELSELASKITQTGRRAHIFIADVSVEAQVQAMVAETVAQLGSLEVMVANAGIFRSGAFVETNVEQFDQLIGVNVRGTMLCYKYAALQMIAQGRGGRIIGASSASGKKGIVGLRGTVGVCAYAASKFAIRGLTQVAAVELGDHNITVNAYAPGSIDTPMLQNVDARTSEKVGVSLAQIEAKRRMGRILERSGTTQDIADLVSFLVSDRASYITGQSISCDGGMCFD